ncbi:MAG: hypothetical protein ACOX3T_04770 [Bdellovibrionota bacterium]
MGFNPVDRDRKIPTEPKAEQQRAGLSGVNISVQNRDLVNGETVSVKANKANLRQDLRQERAVGAKEVKAENKSRRSRAISVSVDNLVRNSNATTQANVNNKDANANISVEAQNAFKASESSTIDSPSNSVSEDRLRASNSLNEITNQDTSVVVDGNLNINNSTPYTVENSNILGRYDVVNKDGTVYTLANYNGPKANRTELAMSIIGALAKGYANSVIQVAAQNVGGPLAGAAASVAIDATGATIRRACQSGLFKQGNNQGTGIKYMTTSA